MTIEIVPYTRIGALLLGVTTQADCLQLLGSPIENRVSRFGLYEVEYPELIVRFDSQTETVVECTLLPYVEASLLNIKVTWDKTFLQCARNLDLEPRNVFGFIVFMKLGIAITGIHDMDESQLAITVFSRGAFDDMVEGSTAYVDS